MEPKERYFEKIRDALKGHHLEFKENSYTAVEGLRAVYALVDGKDRLIVDGCKAFQFSGDRYGGSSGILVCPMNHENRLALNHEFSYTVPHAIGREAASFGFGDRLGIAGESHIAVVRKTKLKPILAQQSLRELSLTGRSYDDVLDAAVWAVFKSGYKDGFGADGDHLKTLEEVRTAIGYGVSMITLDCSLVLQESPKDPKERHARYEKLPEAYRKDVEAEYLEDPDIRDLGIVFDRDTLEETVLIYHDAVDLAEQVYQAMKASGRKIDLEISLDETNETTDPKAHFFVAYELRKRHVVINSLAPRFVGEFQKAIDYIGDVDAFRADLREHRRIADLFGYKISIHSGSDKFKIFPAVAEETGGRFHLKTAGTSWLEAVRVIAETEPVLYRDMHRTALAHLEEAKAYYVVHCDPAKIPPLDEMPDERLPEYLEQDDARQLLHITYGFMLKDDEALHARIMDALARHMDQYRAALDAHFTKHLQLLGCL